MKTIKMHLDRILVGFNALVTTLRFNVELLGRKELNAVDKNSKKVLKIRRNHRTNGHQNLRSNTSPSLTY